MEPSHWYPRLTMRQRLLEERAAIRRQLNLWRNRASQGEEIEELSTYDNHPGDVATELHQREQTAGFMLSRERRLEQIETALQRLDAGGYGLCVRCGGAIAAARMWADPAAARCITCQRQEEEGDRPGRRPGPTVRQEGRGDSAWDLVADYGTASDPANKR